MHIFTIRANVIYVAYAVLSTINDIVTSMDANVPGVRQLQMIQKRWIQLKKDDDDYRARDTDPVLLADMLMLKTFLSQLKKITEESDSENDNVRKIMTYVRSSIGPSL